MGGHLFSHNLVPDVIKSFVEDIIDGDDVISFNNMVFPATALLAS